MLCNGSTLLRVNSPNPNTSQGQLSRWSLDTEMSLLTPPTVSWHPHLMENAWDVTSNKVLVQSTLCHHHQEFNHCFLVSASNGQCLEDLQFFMTCLVSLGKPTTIGQDWIWCPSMDHLKINKSLSILSPQSSLCLYIHAFLLLWREIDWMLVWKKIYNCVYGYMFFCSHGIKLIEC